MLGNVSKQNLIFKFTFVSEIGVVQHIKLTHKTQHHTYTLTVNDLQKKLRAVPLTIEDKTNKQINRY